LIISETLYN